MKVVIDSNVLIAIIGKLSRLRPIWNAFISGRMQLVISEGVLKEYKEILHQHSAIGVPKLIMEILRESPDVILQHIYYNWNAITTDPDDNQFFDIAVAANVDFLVTNDNHFNEAKKRLFPKVNIISSEEFLTIINLQIP